MKTPYDRFAKADTNCLGHMTKMATMSISGKNPLNIFFGTKRPFGLGTWYVALGMWALQGLHK